MFSFRLQIIYLGLVMDAIIDKKLRLAGFPRNRFRALEYVTLSELIEKCGEFGFQSLTVSWDGRWQKYFIAESMARTGGKRTSGKTPEEAVANLWLELNEKHDKQL